MTAPGWLEGWSALVDERESSTLRAVQQGRALVRRGRVDAVRIRPGTVSTTVHDGPSRAASVATELRWPVADTGAWRRASRRLAGDLRAVSALLDATVSDEVAERLEAAGIALVPDLDELAWSCDCGERAVCRHGVALLEATGVHLRRDPTSVLRLRGRDAEVLLRELTATDTAEPDVDTSMPLDALRGPLEAIHVHPAPPDEPARLVDQLGPPPIAELRTIGEVVERAAALAWRIASGDGADRADEEVLLAELRAQRMATADALAQALGEDEHTIGEQLDALYDAGKVLRTGTGQRTRYRVAPRPSG